MGRKNTNFKKINLISNVFQEIMLFLVQVNSIQTKEKTPFDDSKDVAILK